MKTARTHVYSAMVRVVLLGGLMVCSSLAFAQSSLFVDTTGQVGIGTDAPQGNLHIAGSAGADLFNGIGPDLTIGPAFNFGYSGFSFGRSSGFFNVRPDASATGPNPSLRFATQNLQRMLIDRNGNVGIGDFGAAVGNPGTSPLDRLHVKGNIRVEGGSFIDDGTTLNVPDYVLMPDYQLLPLEQLAEYIKREQHLPDIPSMQEIKAKGIKLGEMQMQLLKKIEELTLYTLQQEETITQLRQQNQVHQDALSSLTVRLDALERAQAGKSE
jgi:hypothetical protein